MSELFPRTLAALKEFMREEEDDSRIASDSAHWAVGDALIEECGVDPTWEVDDDVECGGSFKGGLKLRAANDWLESHGLYLFDAPGRLLFLRMMSELYPPETRLMNATWRMHACCDGPEGIAKAVKGMEPGDVLGLMSDDHEAHEFYGPC
jgi:hypothetical protein